MCPAAVKDSNLGENDVHHCDGGADEVDGVNGALGAMMEVLIEDCQGPFLLAWMVREYGVV